jgi:hypothetical protein
VDPNAHGGEEILAGDGPCPALGFHGQEPSSRSHGNVVICIQ